MPIRNNATRLLANRKIPYTVFELPPEKLSAQSAAELLGVPPASVYKTIVVKRLSGRALLVLVPATHALNLKSLAADLGEKKLQLPTQAQAEQLTGLKAGAISPLALLNRGFDVCLDKRARAMDEIYISAGQRGLEVRLAVDELIKLTGARWIIAT